MQDVTMQSIVWEPEVWAVMNFQACRLGDQRRNQRLVKLAAQMALKPDASTPEQFEKWGDLKGVYRLFNCNDITFLELIAPHTQQTRASCAAGSVQLIISDTTEMAFTINDNVEGLRSVGNGGGHRGFFLHSALMLDASTKHVAGLAAQDLFYRSAASRRKSRKEIGWKKSRRKSAERESAVWGRVIDRMGTPPNDVQWLHVCDRGADDFEVFMKALQHGCGFVIRACKLHRLVQNEHGEKHTLRSLIESFPVRDVCEISVQATPGNSARTAKMELRFGKICLPVPRLKTPWMDEQNLQPLAMHVIEYCETLPPGNRHEPIRWTIYTSEEIVNVADAHRVIGYYKNRWAIEDYHKCLKTGCRAESRQYETAAALERVTAVNSVLAVRLLQMRTAANETPNKPAEEVVPPDWLAMLRAERATARKPIITIRDFVRQLAGLGGHLGRKCDGEPGWMTLWRGMNKLHLMLRGHRSMNKCGL
jgi:hypothetical protein